MATVAVWNPVPELERILAYESTIFFPSGEVWIGDITNVELGDRFQLTAGSYICRVFVDEVFQAAYVDISFVAAE